jgi:hypothetical protein
MRPSSYRNRHGGVHGSSGEYELSSERNSVLPIGKIEQTIVDNDAGKTGLGEQLLADFHSRGSNGEEES